VTNGGADAVVAEGIRTAAGETGKSQVAPSRQEMSACSYCLFHSTQPTHNFEKKHEKYLYNGKQCADPGMTSCIG
jgi:hypothetical protein